MQRIARAIEATRSHEADDPDTALLLDLDLSILGADAATYDAFERGIREEYAHVPDDLFAAGRSAILERFQVRAPLFRTRELRAMLEVPAHENIARALAALRNTSSVSQRAPTRTVVDRVVQGGAFFVDGHDARIKKLG